MRSPIHAMLWEIWRVTRVEVVFRLVVGIVGGLTALAWYASVAPPGNPTKTRDFGALVAMVLLVFPHFVGWLSLPRVNQHRAGFPFTLLFTRPVRTTVMVGVPMAYLTAVPVAIYLVSALLLRAISGYPFPLLPVAAWIAALSVAYLAIWPARSKSIEAVSGAIICSAWVMFMLARLTAFPDGFDWHDSPSLWPTVFAFPLTDYALIALIGLASFGVAVAGVRRQRHVVAPAAAQWIPGAGFPERLVNLFRFPCPTSSATRAQLWFELKARGLPILSIGLTFAILIPLMFAVSSAIEAAFPGGIADIIASSFVALSAMFFLAVLVFGGGAFGLRAIESTQPYGSAGLAGLKVLVRSVCWLVALVAAGVSLWASFAFIPVESSAKFGNRIKIAEVPLSSWIGSIESAVAGLTGYELLALAVVVASGVVVWVATFAVLAALWSRYFRRVNTAASLLLLSGFGLALLALAGRYGIVSMFLVDTLFSATRWIAAAAMVLVTVWLLWSAFAERLLTVRYACGALVISAVFGAAWLTVLHAAGVQLAGMSATNAVSMLWPLLLPLMAGALAPWSLNRIRHW
jgi:hypothetical protein